LANVDHTRFRSWNQHVLSNKDRVSYSRKKTGAFDWARLRDRQKHSEEINKHMLVV